MEQTHKTNIALIKLKNKHGFSIATLAKFMHCSINTVKGWTSSPSTTRHRVVPERQLLLFKALLKGRK